MMEHTPGPWKNDGRKLITTVGIVISKDKSLGPIAVVSEENAPLVLAAPEMYEALKGVGQYLISVQNAIPGPGPLYSHVRALLTRIEGEKC